MNTSSSNQEESNSFSTCLNKYLKENVIRNIICYYSSDNLEDQENIDGLICQICLCILNEPLNCSDRKNSHSFCKECINDYISLKGKNECPTCKQNFEFKINNEKINELEKLSFKCKFNNKGCTAILSFSEYLNHINNCEYNDGKYKCNIMKYIYQDKEFKKCEFLGNRIDIENHFISCAYKGFKCNFCDKFVLNMELEEHAKVKCKFGIFNYPSGNKYVGFKSENLKIDYGIFIFFQGDRKKYEGEFNNNLREGFGINYYSNGDRYEGEFKHGDCHGLGTYYFADGGLYEGEFQNDMKCGIGTYYYPDGGIYEGEFKNDMKCGKGIYYFPKGGRYEGQFKDDMKCGIGLTIFWMEEYMKVDLMKIKKMDMD